MMVLFCLKYDWNHFEEKGKYSTSLSYRLHKIIMRTLLLYAWYMAFIGDETFVFVNRLSKM